MAAIQTKWVGWLVVLVVLAALGGGLGYAHAHGQLARTEAWVRHLTSKGGSDKSDHGGMAMNMPGMDMGSMQMAPPSKPSEIPDHAELIIPGEVQQRIGVMVDQVKE